jgi:rubrerythrin
MNMVSQAVAGEAEDFAYYRELAKLTDNAEFIQIIMRIQNDEAKHYGWYTSILARQCCPMPMIPVEVPPADFEEGVKRSILGELDASARYQSIASMSCDCTVTNYFTLASRDEQRHASWLQYILELI